MNSFYGGQNGKDFVVTKVFNNKVALDADLKGGWTSPISVGDFVVISYGMPNNAPFANAQFFGTYEENKELDEMIYEGKTFNSTLWRKAYDEDAGGNANGLYYELIASMSGNTPEISTEIDILHPESVIDVTVDTDNLDMPKITFHLPAAWVFDVDLTRLEPGEDPTATLDKDMDTGTATIELGLPKTLDISVTNAIVAAAANEQASVALTYLKKTVDGEQVDDKTKPVLTFTLPQNERLGLSDTPVVTIGPSRLPQVALDKTDVNNPKLQFSLPRAVKFYYGTLVTGTTGNIEVTDTSFANYDVGDYYINSQTGDTYLLIGKNGNACTFTYQACLQTPTPTLEDTEIISPYKQSGDDWVANDPEVNLTRDDTTHAWELGFKLPKAALPQIDEDSAFIGIEEEGSVSTSLTADNIKFNFLIPRGSRIFSGDEVTDTSLSVTIADAKPGDYYLNTEVESASSGHIYKYQGEGTWQKVDGTLKGPVGDTLKIVKHYRFTPSDGANTQSNTIALIEADLGASYDYQPEEIFAVTWVDNSSAESSYWYFKTVLGPWGVATLTGGVANLILKTYVADEDSKAYNVNYINDYIYTKQEITDMFSWGKFEDLIPPTE